LRFIRFENERRMLGNFLILLIGLIILSEKSRADTDCFAERNDLTRTIRCRSVPNCLTRPEIYENHEHIIFDLENRYGIIANEFFNCSFRRNLNMKFLNIKFVNKHAFQHAIIHENVILKLHFKGPGLHLGKGMSNRELEVNADVFKSMRLNANSKLFVQITDYETVYLSDYLTNSIEQEENTEVDVLVSNGYALIVKSAIFDTDVEKTSNKKFNFMFTNNLTYSFEVFDLDQVVLESQAFANLVVNPYSSCSIMLRSIGTIELSDDLFNTLLLGTHAQFNLLIQSVRHIAFGKNMFHSVQQHQSSVFYFQLDQILTSTSMNDLSEDYSEYYDEDDDGDDEDGLEQPSEQGEKSKSNWLCLPQGLFYNVQHHELAVTQIHFTNINHSISISTDAFKEIKLSENSKFQILFQNLSENVVLNENAISLIKLSDGIFEIWIENHRLDVETQVGTKQTIKSFEMMENAVNKVYMTSRSFFRFGFTNSSAILMLNSNSFNAFHVDNYDILFKYDNKNNKVADYRTKIEFEIDESDYVLYDFKPVAEDGEGERYDTFTLNLPKLIEFDGYKPHFDLFSDVNAVNNVHNSNQLEQQRRLEEFCKFHKLKSFMHSVKLSQIKQTDNLIYFAEAQRLVDANTEQTADSNQVECSSCLFIYLYADLHKRIDFVHLKQHLPKCFLNLHYKNHLDLYSLSNESERKKAMQEIESSFNTYWTRMNCPLLSGGLQTPWTNELNELNSQGFIEANCQTTSEFYQKLKLMRQMNTKRFSSLVCSKQTRYNSTLDRNKLVLDRLREHEKADDEQVQRVQSTSGALVHSSMLTVIIMIVSIGFIVFLVLKYRKPEQPCVRLNFSPKSLCTRFNTVAKFNKISKEDCDQHNSFDDLNAYEYDDEFEMISASNDMISVPNNNINRLEQGFNGDDDDQIRKERSRQADNCASSGQVIVLDGSSTSRLASIQQLARKQFKRLKSLSNPFVRNDQIKFSLINPSDDLSNMSRRSYDSTKNRIIRRNDHLTENCMEDENDVGNVIKMVLEKANSVVSYDIKNSSVRPDVLNRHDTEYSNTEYDSHLTNFNSINLAANPIYQLELVQERLSNEKKNENDADEDEYNYDDEELKQVVNS
jgi:hypothetical protein